MAGTAGSNASALEQQQEEEEEDADEDAPPTTSRHQQQFVVQGIFLLLGIGILAPWNAFISAKEYFDKRLCDVNNAGSNLESEFSLTYTLASVVSLGLLILIQTIKDRLARDEEETLATHVSTDHSFVMVMLPLALYLVAFLGQAWMVRVIQMPLFLTFTFLGLAICGMACGIAQAGIVATAGRFPNSDLAMNPYMAGMSLGGVAVSGASLISTAAYSDPQRYWDSHCAGNDPDSSSERQVGECQAYQRVDQAVFVYFFLGSATLGLCMVGFSYIVRIIRHQDDHGTYGSVAAGDEPAATNDTAPEHQLDEIQDNEPLPAISSAHSTNETVQVWNQIQAPAIAIFLVFAVTLSLFPAWTSQIKSAQQCQSSTWRLQNDLWTPMTFVLFNSGDLAGRLLSSRIPLATAQNRSRRLVQLAVLRFMFYILLLLCPGGNRSTLVMNNDIYTVLVLLLFAVSNGYIVSAAFCHAPSLIASVPEFQERMAEILNLSLSVGLLVGSLLSFPVAAFMSG